jgi:hypothetical protein
MLSIDYSLCIVPCVSQEEAILSRWGLNVENEIIVLNLFFHFFSLFSLFFALNFSLRFDLVIFASKRTKRSEIQVYFLFFSFINFFRIF